MSDPKKDVPFGWLIPVTPLVGLEEAPGLIGIPTGSIYLAPTLDEPPTISLILNRGEQKAVPAGRETADVGA
jgi:hypothetical protein